jgi:hypothetical protein
LQWCHVQLVFMIFSICTEMPSNVNWALLLLSFISCRRLTVTRWAPLGAGKFTHGGVPVAQFWVFVALLCRPLFSFSSSCCLPFDLLLLIVTFVSSNFLTWYAHISWLGKELCINILIGTSIAASAIRLHKSQILIQNKL